MIVIGVIGGVASGKSAVTDMLRSLGASVLDADQIGHQVLSLAEVQQAIRKRWGPGVFLPDGQVDRRALAKIVFDPEQPDELTALESITHPQIESRLREQIRETAGRDQPAALILDAPVMVKTGWYRLCDVLLFVDCPLARRLEFAATRGWDRQMLEQREARQAPLPMKQELATHTLNNDGTLQQLQDQVRLVWDEITSQPTHPISVEP